MFVAVILAAKCGAEARSYFEGGSEESPIEHVAATVLRGPFGGVLVASHAEIDERVREKLNGFAVKFVDPPQARDADAVRSAGLKAAADFRARWEKVRAEAAGRFGGNAQDWEKHKRHADVKVRGLARSFERDGVLLVPGDALKLSKEKVAVLIEKFVDSDAKNNLLSDAEIDGLQLLDWRAVQG